MELTTFVGRPRRARRLSKEKKKIDHHHRCRDHGAHRQACSPYGFHWAYDTHALAVGTGGALVKQGGDSWFFLTADYAFGYSLEENTGNFVTENGGTVVGVGSPSARNHRLLLLPAAGAVLQAPRSIGACQCRPRHLQRRSSRRPSSASSPAASASPRFCFTLAEVHGLGLEAAQGLTLTEGFYWDRDEESRQVRRALLRAHRPHAEHGPGRHLFGRDPVPEGHRQGRHRRHRCRCQGTA